MNIQGQAALVTGGASGLGAQTARELARRGAKVAVLDRNGDGAKALAAQIGGIGIACDITSTDSVLAALAEASQAHGTARILMNIAGIGSAKRIVSKDGSPAPLEDFRRVVEVNLIGTYNVTRLAVAEMVKLEPLADTFNSQERGVVVCTASVAAFDGQVGQQAYSASKGGVVGMTLPIARDLSDSAIRVNTILPGIFDTPLMQGAPQAMKDALGAQVPFPKRLGRDEEYASLALEMVKNSYFNGEDVRLDGAIRMAPR